MLGYGSLGVYAKSICTGPTHSLDGTLSTKYTVLLGIKMGLNAIIECPSGCGETLKWNTGRQGFDCATCHKFWTRDEMMLPWIDKLQKNTIGTIYTVEDDEKWR